MITTEDAKLKAECLVSRWHHANRQYLGGGGGVDWQARKALVEDVAAALAECSDTIEAPDDAQLRRRRNRGSDPQQ